MQASQFSEREEQLLKKIKELENQLKIYEQQKPSLNNNNCAELHQEQQLDVTLKKIKTNENNQLTISKDNIDINDHQKSFKIPTNLDIEQILTKSKIERYSRQMLLPEISFEGQKKIENSKVLIIGAGGIGAPAAMYLAGAGIGTLGIVDGDKVEESNLHRQIIHDSTRVGINKAESAKMTLEKFNKNIKINIYKEFLNPLNAGEIIKQYDIILDASDNAQAKYLVNDAKILVGGAALKWEGQITIYGYKNGPCYRCLFPQCPQANIMGSCSTNGVVGMIPGLVGQLQAIETLKLIIGESQVLSGQLLIFDGLTATFKKLKIRQRQNNCIVCGQNPTLLDTSKYNYDEFIGQSCQALKPALEDQDQISWSEFLEIYKNKDKQKIQLIDVRDKVQFNIVHFKDFINIELNELKQLEDQQLNQIFKKNQDLTTYIMCKRGITSVNAVKYLKETKNIQNVKNIIGGINEYTKAIDNQIPNF